MNRMNERTATNANRTATNATNTTSNILKGFKPYGAVAATPTIIFRPNTINFNKVAIDALKKAPYCQILINEEEKKIALVAESQKTPGSHTFFQTTPGKQDCVRWASKKEVTDLFKISGIPQEELKKGGIKFGGELVEEGLLIFDLGKVVE